MLFCIVEGCGEIKSVPDRVVNIALQRLVEGGHLLDVLHLYFPGVSILELEKKF